MKSNIFAIYKGKEYQAGMRADGSVILRSNDEKDIRSQCFFRRHWLFYVISNQRRCIIELANGKINQTIRN